MDVVRKSISSDLRALGPNKIADAEILRMYFLMKDENRLIPQNHSSALAMLDERMADPLTVLGAMAATAQLAEQLMKVSSLIHELYINIQQAAKIIGSRILAVNRLISLSRLIMTNDALQTEAIAHVLGTCLGTAQKLKSVLEKMKGNRFKQAVLVMAKEKEVIGLLDDLEKEKSLLMLCMQEIDCRLLNAVQKDVTAMRDELLGKGERAQEMLPNVDRRYYEVPNRRVRSFVGRGDILKRIKDQFLDLSPATRIVVLKAMGGQGKTQIALEICRHMKEICTAIFWIDATSENSLKKDFAQIYEKIKRSDMSLADTHSKAVYIQSIFSEWPHPWLMVFDNYDDPLGFSNFEEFIPKGSSARILITSRHADTLALTDERGGIELQGLHPKDAVELLVKQSALLGVQHDDCAASAIVERLGYHPLAIDQAGSYIHKRRISLQEFLVDYESRQKTVLYEVPRMTQYRRKASNIDQEIPLNVFTTCELSYQQLLANQRSNRSSGELLTFIAFFHCSSFNEWILKAFWNNPLRTAWVPEMSRFLAECLGFSNGNWDSALFLDMLVELRDVSLIQSFHNDRAEGCYLTLHPLIQDWLILRIDRETCIRYSIWATNVLLCSIDTRDLSFRRLIVQYIARNNTNTRRFLQSAIKGDDVYEWTFANAQFSDFLVNAGLYEDAEITIEGAICAIDQLDKYNTLAHTLRLKRHLARIWQFQCRWEAATNLYRDISREMRNIAPEATYTAQELASCPMDVKEESVAQMLRTNGEQATVEDDGTRNNIYSYDILSGLFGLLRRHGKLLEADLVLSEAKSLMKQTIINHGPVRLELLDVMSRTITSQCRAPKVVAMHIDLIKRKLGSLATRPEPLMTANQLLEILLDIAAADQTHSVLIPEAIYQRILHGEIPLEGLEILSLLAEALLRVGKFCDARRVAEKASKGYKLHYGVNHPRTLQNQLRLAMAVPLPNAME